MSRIKTIILSACIAATLLAASRSHAQPNMGDDCYAPTKPLTEEVRRSFVEEVKVLAAKAEIDHGVPGPILLAMSIDESGYGTTKLAIAANNVLSFKWYGRAGPGGRSLFTLSCQPKEDKNNVYIVFSSRADSADYVASRLANSKYYKAATQTYRSEVAQGKDRKAAAKQWLATIAPTYNPYHTERYRAKLLKIADDPVGQSGILKEGGAWSLWALNAQNSVEGNAAKVVAAQKRAYVINDSSNSCPDRTNDLHGWPAHLLRDCIYSQSLKGEKSGQKLEGRVVLLKVPAVRITEWIETACSEQLPGVAKCFDAVLFCAIANSSMQFPVAGNVIEDMGSGPKNWMFRNGMTVRMHNQPNDSDNMILSPWRDQLIDVNSESDPNYIDYIKTGFTRYWRTNPARYLAKYPGEDVPTTLNDFVSREKWLSVVQAEMRKALETSRNRLLDAWLFNAKAGITALAIKPKMKANECPS